MGLLTAIAETRATKQILGHPQDPVLAHWFGGGERTTSGESVTEDSALNYSAVWAAVRILSGSGGMLPLKMYRRTDGGGKEEARKHPVWKLVHDRPNEYMSSMMFRSSRIKYQVNAGNGYAEIERTGRGDPVALWPIHSSRVTPKYTPDRSLYYEIKNNNGAPGFIKADDMLHVPSIISDDGICGKGVITHARESIGMGMATERHGAALFGNGARPGFVVKHPKVMSKEARQHFRHEWNEIYQGPENAHKMAILSEGADITPLGFSPEDSQFLATRQHNVEEIARWYGVPPHMIQHLLRATFNNIEHQSVEFVTYSLMPWLVIWEQELNRKLLREDERDEYFFEHLVDGLLRGDAYTRAQALQIQALNGALTIDEWRSIENRNPLPDGLGGMHFVQLNMQTVEQAKKLSEQPLPDPNKTALPVEPPKAEEENPPIDEKRLTEIMTSVVNGQPQPEFPYDEIKRHFDESNATFLRNVESELQHTRKTVVESANADCEALREFGQQVRERLDSSETRVFVKFDEAVASITATASERGRHLADIRATARSFVEGACSNASKRLVEAAGRKDVTLIDFSRRAEVVFTDVKDRLARNLGGLADSWSIWNKELPVASSVIADLYVADIRNTLVGCVKPHEHAHKHTEEEVRIMLREAVAREASSWLARVDDFVNTVFIETPIQAKEQ